MLKEMIKQKRVQIIDDGERCDRCANSQLWSATISNRIQSVQHLCEDCQIELGLKRARKKLKEKGVIIIDEKPSEIKPAE